MITKILTASILAITLTSANAVTWWQNGYLFGNVCRAGLYYTVYPMSMGQLVGTSCPIRDNSGNIIGTGVVSNE
jgi:hypothetical protein